MQQRATPADRLEYWTAIAARPRHAVRAKFHDLPDAPLTLHQVNRLHATGHLLKAQQQVNGKPVVVAKWSTQHHELASPETQTTREAWWRKMLQPEITEDQADESPPAPRP